MPVASFCASETAETGRIANGREQGDHVSRRQESFKVFCPTFCTLQKVGVAAERQKNLILFVRICCFGCADSRFGKTRISRKGTVLFFSLVRKERGVPQRFANLWTPGTIQISARYMIFSKMTGVHHVTGRAGDCRLPGYRR